MCARRSLVLVSLLALTGCGINTAPNSTTPSAAVTTTLPATLLGRTLDEPDAKNRKNVKE